MQLSKYRHQEGLFLAAGPRVVEEVFQSPLEVEAVCVSSQSVPQLESIIRKAGSVAVYEGTDTELKQLAGTETSPGVVAVVKLPKHQYRPVPERDSVVMGLNGIQDPGNVGTIIRTAAWLGATTVAYDFQCADPWGPKTVRASAGTLGYVNIFRVENWETFIGEWQEAGGLVVGLDLDGIPLTEYDSPGAHLIIVGSEAHGLAPEIRRRVKHYLTITKRGRGESLNASMAAAMALFWITHSKVGTSRLDGNSNHIN